VARAVRSVGLTGGIGSGKSEVERLLAGHGAVVVDSDRLAREVVEPGTPGFADVVAAFGPEVVGPDGRLDRAALAARVFTDEQARERLEAIVHPLVAAADAAVTAGAPAGSVVVHSVPLLVENGLADRYDVVVVVDAPEEVRLERLVRVRGMSEEDARRRMAAQASREERLSAADHVVVNDGTLEDLRDRVAELWEHLRG
jgi:dephospho-CoA kinase